MTRAVRCMVTLIFVLVLAACGGPPKPKGEILIYVVGPLSGFQANGGQTVLGGANLMATRVNREGGVLGSVLRVVGLDDESDSEKAVEVANRIKADLAAGQKVVAVIGHYNSGQTLAAMEIYKSLPIMVVTPTSSEVSLTQKGYTNFFRVNANDATQGQVDADFLVHTLKAKRVAVIHNDTAYGVGLRDQISTALKALGAEVPLTIQVKEGQNSYTSEVAQIKAASPDAIFYAGYEIETPYLRADLMAASVNVPMLASDGAFLAPTIDEAQGAAEGLYVSAFAPSPKTVVDEQWIREYQAIEYRNPDTYSINGYAAVEAVVQAIRRANSLEPAKILAAAREIEFDSPMGKIAFDGRGDRKEQRVFIFQVKNAQFVQVWP